MAKAEKWDGNNQYVPGDEVEHHGAVFRAKMPINNPVIAPYVSDNNPHWEHVPVKHEESAPIKRDEPVVDKPKS